MSCIHIKQRFTVIRDTNRIITIIGRMFIIFILSQLF